MINGTSGPTSRVYFSQRLRLHYVDWGNDDAPPLILQHGGRDHCRSWDWVAKGLDQNRFRIIAPDLRGHGESAWANDGVYDMASLVYDLSEIVRQLELTGVRLVGHSLGGSIAVRYAAVCPEAVSRLVAIEGISQGRTVAGEDGKPNPAAQMRAWFAEQREIVRRPLRPVETLEEGVARMRSNNPRLTADQAEHLTRHALRKASDDRFRWKFDPAGRVGAFDDISRDEVRALRGDITCPVLLIYGKDSWATDPQTDGRLEHFRNARLVMAEGAGHWVQHDRLDLVLEELAGFF